MADWDRQQELYIPARETRYQLMTDLIAEDTSTADHPVRVLDLACGPGSASLRVARALPGVEIVAVDVDPVLLALGERTWPGDLPAPRWVRADLTDDTWPVGVGAHAPFDAVVSSTALHWLTPADLHRVYAGARLLLRPGGLLLNGDFAPTGDSTPLTELADRVTQQRERRASEAGIPDWDQWWAEVETNGRFTRELRERAEVFGDRERTPAPTRGEHLHALAAAGFTAPAVIWQDLDEVLFAAVA